VAAVFSFRPREGASISTPIAWDELETGLRPGKWGLRALLQDGAGEEGAEWMENEKCIAKEIKRNPVLRSSKSDFAKTPQTALVRTEARRVCGLE